ncbi:carbohydrate ABC transporter permease [Homoserinibacter sp. YIM 151385]|uniref:carbohydrate ABC transporter permease n=1 Tax=Homoserinibacter sp. YIM 151385 TaxID=2985506 RepID=UPI0022F04451|nr:carbohydrate ABC transporter permease [Homoserinibacter sp. YIM 151385]WBU37449.1 carbohydrate ABC transporter permease [Homoserinibacter sp. YIM 151385]
MRSQRIVLNLFLVAACFIAVYPFLVMLFGSFKDGGQITANPAGIPTAPTVDNFVDLLTGRTGAIVWRALLNSVIVTVPYTALTVLISSMAGYAFARYDFRGKRVLFGVLIASMLVPIEVNIPTMYAMFAQIDWLNSYQVQIVPGTASVISMFMARQFMEGLPGEVFEAARVDGAGHWRSFWRIGLPMSAPVLGAIAVLTFVAKWSDYLWPRIMTSDPAVQTFMVLLPALGSGDNANIIRIETLLAGAVLIVLPLVLVFLRFQNNLMNGVTGGAVRG